MKTTHLLLPISALFLASCATSTDSPDQDIPAGHTQSDAKRKIIGLQEKFDRFDYDGNGELTRNEIIDGLRNEGIPGVTPAEIDQLFAKYDTDRSGTISIPEVNAAEAAQR